MVKFHFSQIEESCNNNNIINNNNLNFKTLLYPPYKLSPKPQFANFTFLPFYHFTLNCFSS